MARSNYQIPQKTCGILDEVCPSAEIAGTMAAGVGTAPEIVILLREYIIEFEPPFGECGCHAQPNPEAMLMKLSAQSPPRGFTLIELLIVVAIIAILAAIAVPNFLEAQTRAKVSRCLADVRTMRTGLESYAVDHNRYPEGDKGVTTLPLGQISFFRLTTPVSYLSSIPPSPFKEKYGTSTPTNPKIASTIKSYLYVRKIDTGSATVTTAGYITDRRAYLMLISAADILAHAQTGNWEIKSVGPDNLDDRDSVANQGFGANARVYDPTNGTVSRGDIAVFSDRPHTGKNN
jgi:type II secretion system protein G